jgi:hypothetical protein
LHPNQEFNNEILWNSKESTSVVWDHHTFDFVNNHQFFVFKIKEPLAPKHGIHHYIDMTRWLNITCQIVLAYDLSYCHILLYECSHECHVLAQWSELVITILPLYTFTCTSFPTLLLCKYMTLYFPLIVWFYFRL